MKAICILYLFLFICFSSCSEKKEVKAFQPLEIVYPENNKKNIYAEELGEKLFFDSRLSSNNKVSCASCHNPNLAFADTVAFSKGVYHRTSKRNSPSIINVGFLTHFMAEGLVNTLEQQVLIPLLDSNEMDADFNTIIKRLKADALYVTLAQKAYGREIDPFVITRSISAYERTLIDFNSPFDKYYFNKEQDAISENAKKGWHLFSKELNCIKCHALPLFTNGKTANNGMFINYKDKGLFDATLDSLDLGKFKIPTLRNVSKTFPYMHNGSIKDLDEVIERYSKGGLNFKTQDTLIRKLDLTTEQKKALKEFLEVI